MERIKKLWHNGKEILCINYQKLSEKEMIEQMKKLNSLIHQENKKVRLLVDYRNAYTTPGYLEQANNYLKDNGSIIIKGAFLGVNSTKSILLNSVSKSFDMNFQKFDNEQDALDFLSN